LLLNTVLITFRVVVSVGIKLLRILAHKMCQYPFTADCKKQKQISNYKKPFQRYFPMATFPC
jgi:hypothetical protein